mgnify:CR=1 FL=1
MSESPEQAQEGDRPIEKAGVPMIVTQLTPIASQVGEHVAAALAGEGTVAVLTTITGSRRGQQVVSIPLSGEHVAQINSLLEEIHASDEPEHVPCVGFHCYIDQDNGQ